MNGNSPSRFARLRAVAAFGLVLAGCWLAASPTSAAEGSAPAMSGIQEMVVQGIRFGSDSGKNACGIREDLLLTQIVKGMKNYGLPAMSTMEAKPAKFGVARIEIVPEVLTSNSQGIDCTSWVSITAQSHNTLRVQPVETPRNVIVTYWRAHILVSSSETSHHQVLTDAFDKLLKKLAQQYRMDQPPPLPSLEE